MAAWGSFHHTMTKTKALSEKSSGKDISAWSEFVKEDILLADHGVNSSDALTTINPLFVPSSSSSSSSSTHPDNALSSPASSSSSLSSSASGLTSTSASTPSTSSSSTSSSSSPPLQLAAWGDFGNTNNIQPALEIHHDNTDTLSNNSANSSAPENLRSSMLLQRVAAGKGGMTLRSDGGIGGGGLTLKGGIPKTIRDKHFNSSNTNPNPNTTSTIKESSEPPTPQLSTTLSTSSPITLPSFIITSDNDTNSTNNNNNNNNKTTNSSTIAVVDSPSPIRNEGSNDFLISISQNINSNTYKPMAPSDSDNETMLQAKQHGQAALAFHGDASAAVASLSTGYRYSRFKHYLSLLSGTMPQAAQWIEPYSVGQFIDSCLRGYGQILFMNNPISGLFFLIAIFVHSRYYGVCSILGSIFSTGLAYFLQLNHASIRSGLFGFNGVLCAIGVALFQNKNEEGWNEGLLYIPVIMVPAFSTLIVVIIGNILVRYFGLATFTLPFHVATWTWLLGSQIYAYFPSEGAAGAPTLNAVTTSADRVPMSYDTESVLKTFGANIAQVFFLENHISGYIIIAGVAVCSRISAIMCVYGSLLSIGIAMGLGAPAGWLYAGLLGFNPVIVAAAIGGMFYVMSKRVFALATLGAIASILVHAAVASALKPFGLPALTFPSAVTSLGFCLLAGAIPGAIPVELSQMTVPEDHLRRQRLSNRILSKFAAVRKFVRQLLLNSSSQLDQQFLEKLFVPILLCQAAAKGNLKEVQELIELGADPNLGDFQSGRTPLHIAASEGHIDIVRYLLFAGSKVNQIDLYGNTPLDDAISSDHPSTVALALGYFGGVHNTPPSTQARILNELAAQGQADKIARRLQLGYDADACDLYDSRSGLHIACSEGNAAVAMVFISCGASLLLKDRFNHTPLDDAQNFGHLKLYQWLVTEGPAISSSASGLLISTSLTNSSSSSAAAAATTTTKSTANSSSENAFMIKKRKTTTNLFTGVSTTNSINLLEVTTTKAGSKTDLDELKQHQEQFAEEDVEITEPVSSRDFFTTTSKVSTLTEIAKLLANETSRDSQALLPTILSAAAVFGNTAAISSILDASISPSLPDYDKNTSLHFAAGTGNLEIAGLLIASGADVNAMNRWNQTPLDIAVLSHCSVSNVSALSAVLVQHRRITPFHIGSYGKSSTPQEGLDIIRYLVSHGATLGLSLKPMTIAEELCDLIIVTGAAIKEDPKNAAEIMKSALQELSLWIVAGADVSSVEYDHRTALHVAAAEGLIEFVKALILAGANVLAKDRWNQTPKDEARINNHSQVVFLLAAEESKLQSS